MIRRVLVADDEPLARDYLTRLLRVVAPHVDVREAADGHAALETIRGFEPDVVFLDVHMPGRNGFEVIAAIGVDRMPLTVIVTAFDQHAIPAFSVSAVDYLLKPFDAQRFRDAWQRTETRYALHSVIAESDRLAALLTTLAAADGRGDSTARASRRFAQRLMVTHDQRKCVVKLADVEWLEAAGNYVLLHTRTVTHRVRERLSALEQRLDPDRFIRVHRGAVVSLDAIHELHPRHGGDQLLILRSGHTLRVSRTFREHITRRLGGIE